jgi:hypothetical protein
LHQSGWCRFSRFFPGFFLRAYGSRATIDKRRHPHIYWAQPEHGIGSLGEELCNKEALQRECADYSSLDMEDFLTLVLAARRQLKQALRDLRTKYRQSPSPNLAEMIRQLEAEISHREAAGKKKKQNNQD